MKKLKKIVLGILFIAVLAFCGAGAAACSLGGTGDSERYSINVDKTEVEYGESVRVYVYDTSLYPYDIYFYADSKSRDDYPYNQVAWKVYEFNYVIKEDTTFYMTFRQQRSNEIKVKIKPFTGIELTADKSWADYGETITLTAKTPEGGEVYCTEYYVVEDGVERKLDGNTYVMNAASATFYAKHETGVESERIKTTANVAYISTVEELKAMSDGWYMMEKNIDLQGEDWTPLTQFTGRLTGNGHKISNLKLSENQNNLGFFAENKGTVESVTFENVEVAARGDKSNIGVIAGKNNGTVKNCKVNGTVTAKYSQNVGGLVGENGEQGVMQGCENNATIEAGNFTGGIVGRNKGTIESCTNKGTIIGKSQVGGVVGVMADGTCLDIKNTGNISASGPYVGGIAGEVLAATKEMKGLNNVGKVENEGSDTGGLVGIVSATNISEFVQTGEVKGNNSTGGLFGACEVTFNISSYENKAAVSGTTNVGGLVGWAKTGTKITDCVNSGSVTGQCYLGGIVGGGEASLTGCENKGKITNFDGQKVNNALVSYVGGIAGQCVSLEACENSAEIIGVGSYVGGFAGTATTVKDCKNTVPVTGVNYVGGAVGHGKIANNVSNGGTVTGEKRVGGVLGNANGGEDGSAKIEVCENVGNVSGLEQVGGIVGHSGSLITYTGNENKGIVSGTKQIGGIVGYMMWATMTGSVNDGAVSGEEHVGGIVGEADRLILMEYCENSGAVQGKNYVGGVVGFGVGLLRHHGGNHREWFDFSDCLNKGTVVGENHVGGVFGQLRVNIGTGDDQPKNEGAYTWPVERCENKGDVSGTTNVGGVCGSASGNAVSWKSWGKWYTAGVSVSFTQCENSGNIVGSSFVGSVLGNKGTYVSTTDCTNGGTVNGEAAE
ncbi:MAG: hypothetical protein IJ506_06855 [Clostridia bacterium]|nr:hypothetical protein [Clostridia bacterium]